MSAIQVTRPDDAFMSSDSKQDSKLARMEMAALNATTVQEQVPYDGWLLRWSAHSRRRMRSINVIAAPTLPLQERLLKCAALYKQHGLPLMFRLTSLCPEPELSEQLQALGFERSEETRVMAMPLTMSFAALPTTQLEHVDIDRFVQVIGEIRGETRQHKKAHERRLKTVTSGVKAMLLKNPQHGYVAGELAVLDDGLLGLFDIATATEHRRSGYARMLVSHMLACGVEQDASDAYLQVELTSRAARSLYQSYGFSDCYGYRYYSATNFNAADTEHK